MASYVRNVWYMVAWEQEVPEAGFLARTIMDMPLLFFRSQKTGAYVAMVDRCPHRFAPLSLGRREGDTVVCGYHGLAFDETGVCVKNPFSDLVPPNCRVATPRVEARDSALWMWGGEPGEATPETIPDLSFLNGVAHQREMFTFSANYELATDNLMDLSHTEYVHSQSFGGGGVFFNGQHAVREDGDIIWSNWWAPNIPPPPWATFLPPETKLDHWLEMRWHAPATMVLEIGICFAGQDRSHAPIPPIIGTNIVTPETGTTSHYFYNFLEGTYDPGPAFRDEDAPMLEAVQRRMGGAEFWASHPAILGNDAGAIRARRRLMKLRREEAHGGDETAPEAAMAQAETPA